VTLAFGNAPQRNAARGKHISLLARDPHVTGHRIDEAGPALGTDRPGIDRHKADIVLAVLRSECERQVLSGSICRPWRDLPVGRFDPVITNQVDDAAAPLLLHDRQYVLQAAHITHEFELQRLRPMLFAQELEYSTGRRPGVVDQDIDAPKRGVSILDKGLGSGRLGKISRYGDDFAICLAPNLGRRFFQWLLATRADCDIDTLASQGKGDRLADTGARSGDECRLAVHLEIHGFP
jgi:hypothetical protein